MAKAAFGVVAVLFVGACGGVVSDGGGAHGDAGAEGQRRNPLCPPRIPRDGEPCKDAVDCEYRTPDAPSYCTTMATCTTYTAGEGLLWAVYPPRPECVVRAPECPADPQAVAGTPCTAPLSLTCYYDTGACSCSPVSCYPYELGWSCVPWGDGCPSPLPLLGDSCAPGTASCGGVCGGSPGGSRECKNGYWVGTVYAGPCFGCPVP